MEESGESRVSEESSDEKFLEFDDYENFSTAAAAAAARPSDVMLDDDADVWENMSNISSEQAEAAGSMPADRERSMRQRRLAMYDALLQDAVDNTDDLQDWARVFRAHEVLRHADDFEEMEGVVALLLESLHDRAGQVDDHRRFFQECQVCLETVKLNKRACCGLAVCDNCARSHVVTQLQDIGVVRIGCPNPACGSFMFQEEIRQLLRARTALRDRYDRWLVDFNADPRRKTCPRCCRITQLTQVAQSRDASGSRRTADKYGVPVDCADCQLRWCFACQAPWHDRLTCAENRAGDELLKRWARQRTARSDNNAQRCPKCKIYIQRSSGCDHMQCSRCRTKFCYRCGSRRFKVKVFGYPLEDHDKKYSIIGCNDRFADNKRLRRMCTRGGIFGAKVVGGLFAVPVVCGVAGLALAAVTVAAPFYGVYRLVKHVRRPATPSTSRDDSFLGSEWDVDIAEMMEHFAAAAELRRPLSTALPAAATTPPSDFEDVEIDHEDETLPPPLPPRQSICRVAVESRRTPSVSSALDRSYFQSVEDVDIDAPAEPLPLPPLPPRTTICRKSANPQSARRPPPPPPTPAPHQASMNQPHFLATYL